MSVLSQLEAKLRGAIGNLLRRAELTMVNAEYGAQLAGYAGDGSEDEQFEDVELWQQYGIASRPPADSEALICNLGGVSDNAVAFATNCSADRPADLTDGEVVTHGRLLSGGQAQVRHQPDGTLALACATGKFVEVGGADAKLIKGESFNTAMNAVLAKLATDLTTLGAACIPPILPAALPSIAEIASYVSGSASMLATKGKVA